MRIAIGHLIKFARRPGIGMVAGALALVLVAPRNAVAQCAMAPVRAVDGEAWDRFGVDVALDGTRAVIGAPNEDQKGINAGAAYVLEYMGGAWTEVEKLLAPDGAAGTNFGSAVDLYDDLIAIGAPRDPQRGFEAGAVYLFRSDGKDWRFDRKITASDSLSGDQFGTSVAIGAGRIVVGAPGTGLINSNNEIVPGTAYVYEEVGAQWVETRLDPSDGVGGDFFGQSVATSDDTIVIGAFKHDEIGTDSGVAYVFEQPDGAWMEVTTLIGSTVDRYDDFGRAVAIDEDIMVIGAWTRATAAFPGVGSAFVFHRENETWIEKAELTPDEGEVRDGFGWDVAIDRDIIVVGAPWTDDGLVAEKGAVYSYQYDGATWNSRSMLIGEDPCCYQIARAVDVSNNVALLGHITDDANGPFTGSVVFYVGVAGADCNDNGLHDACEIEYGLTLDTDGDFLPDECGDCNDNGTPDWEDIESGASRDLNFNMRPDACDLAAGASVDCNGNGIVDEADVLHGLSHASGPLGPFGGFGFGGSLVIPNATASDSDVLILIAGSADLDSSVTEYVDVDLNGLALGRVFLERANNCPRWADFTRLTVPREVFNDAIDGGGAVFTLSAPNEVVPVCDEGEPWVSIEVLYFVRTILDVDASGLPDDCECIADVDANSIVNMDDLYTVFIAWSTADPAADVTGDGVVDTDDFLTVLRWWGPCL